MITSSKPTNQEQIRLLRSKLIHRNDVPEVLLITSTKGNEGKTTIATSLAGSLVAVNRKTIVIHADFREGIASEDERGQPGLSDFLSKNLSKDQLIHQTESDSYSVIHAGTPSPFSTELLEGSAFKQLIETLKEDFDMIIIDGPPSIQVSDSIPLMDISEAAILAVEERRTKESEILEVAKQLQEYHVQLLGAVMTKVQSY